MTNKIKKQDIISDEAVNNVKRLNSELDKLDKKLEAFLEKYNVPREKILDIMKLLHE
jgi:hypothetical protein